MKRNYWPLLFIGIFTFTLGMIIWTIKSAVSVPVIEDNSFMKKYQDVEEHYNEMMDSNVLFRSKYNFDFFINDKQFALTTEDIVTFEINYYATHLPIRVGTIPKSLSVLREFVEKKSTDVFLADIVVARSALARNPTKFHPVSVEVFRNAFFIRGDAARAVLRAMDSEY